MPLKILRNDITKMNTDAIVNTANAWPTVGAGCDRAVYEAAGSGLVKIDRQQAHALKKCVQRPGVHFAMVKRVNTVSRMTVPAEAGVGHKINGHNKQRTYL